MHIEYIFTQVHHKPDSWPKEGVYFMVSILPTIIIIDFYPPIVKRIFEILSTVQGIRLDNPTPGSGSPIVSFFHQTFVTIFK